MKSETEIGNSLEHMANLHIIANYFSTIMYNAVARIKCQTPKNCKQINYTDRKRIIRHQDKLDAVLRVKASKFNNSSLFRKSIETSLFSAIL